MDLSDEQMKRLGITPPPHSAGRPPRGAADNSLRRRVVRFFANKQGAARLLWRHSRARTQGNPEFSPAARPPPGAGSYFGATPPFAPAASTPPAPQSGGGLFGITPSSAGMASPGVRAACFGRLRLRVGLHVRVTELLL